MDRLHRRALAAIAGLVLMASAQADDQPFTLNLQQAELSSLIETVAERTGKRFIVDPRVDAQVTVISSVPVENDELFEVFRSVLAVHGYAAVDMGDMTLVIPAASAPQRAIPTGGDEAPQGGGIVTRVLTVEHVAASQLVPILRPLVSQEGQLAAYGPTNRLIITDSAANTERILQIIDRVDQPIEREIEAIQLEHANAESVLDVITEMTPQGDNEQTRIAADSRSNSVIIRGSEQARIELRALIADLDQPAGKDEDTRVVHLEHAKAEDLVEVVSGAASAQANLSDDSEGDSSNTETVVQAEESSNALVLSGRPDEIDGLVGLIRDLDIRRAQVHVEALIAEVATDKTRDLGVQFVAGDTDEESAAALTRFGGQGNDLLGVINSPESIGSGFSIGAVTDNASGNDFGALLRAVASDAENNILSTPSLVTMDNQEAEILVGEEVPFVTGQFTGQDVDSDSGRSPFQTIEREDVGISLGVTPQINEGDTVQLEIEQEVSDIAGTSQAADLVTNTREINTTVVVEDRQTLVLGGLIDESVRSTREKVPLLGDIPVLGRLFRFDSTDTVEQNLMVFLQPTILRDVDAGNEITREPYNEMRDQQLEYAEEAGEEASMPVLPKLEIEVGDDAASAPETETDSRPR